MSTITSVYLPNRDSSHSRVMALMASVDCRSPPATYSVTRISGGASSRSDVQTDEDTLGVGKVPMILRMGTGRFRTRVGTARSGPRGPVVALQDVDHHDTVLPGKVLAADPLEILQGPLGPWCSPAM